MDARIAEALYGFTDRRTVYSWGDSDTRWHPMVVYTNARHMPDGNHSGLFCEAETRKSVHGHFPPWVSTDPIAAWKMADYLCADRGLWINVSWCPYADDGMEHEQAVATLRTIGKNTDVATATGRTREEAMCMAVLSALAALAPATPKGDGQ